jgi:MinD superfamily P-loop ATPase
MKIAITGGKGGTGKTVFAVNLALALAKQGKKVTYIDCDADCPSSHYIVGAELQNEEGVDSFLPEIDKEKCIKCGTCIKTCQFNSLYQPKDKLPVLVESLCSGCAACMIACPADAITESSKIIGNTYSFEKYGVQFFCGKLNPSDPLTEKIVGAIKVRALENQSDIFIIDTAAGAHCQVVAALEGADMALAVTEPTLFGEHDLSVISDVLKKLEIPFEVVLNRSTISDRKIKNALEIPYDKTMINCYVQGVPIVEKHPEHEISKSIFSFAERLIK